MEGTMIFTMYGYTLWYGYIEWKMRLHKKAYNDNGLQYNHNSKEKPNFVAENILQDSTGYTS